MGKGDMGGRRAQPPRRWRVHGGSTETGCGAAVRGEGRARTCAVLLSTAPVVASTTTKSCLRADECHEPLGE